MAEVLARILTVRDTIIETINTTAQSWTTGQETIEAKASYLPEYRLANLTVMQLDVRIVNEDTEVTDRRVPPSSEDVYHLEITLQKEVSPYDPDKLDSLVSLGKRIAKLFPVNAFIGALSPEVVVTSNDHDLYDVSLLRDFGVFYTKIELSLREFVTN